MADEFDVDDSPWRQRGFIMAAALVAVLVVLAIVLAVSGGESDEPGAAAAPPSTNAAPPSSPQSDSACGLPNGDQDVPTTTPGNTRWELVGTMAAPYAPKTLGPAKVKGGLKTCFARSPLGALYAAANFLASSTAKDPAKVYEILGADTANKRAVIEDAIARSEPRLDSEGSLQIVGFRYGDFTPDSASLEMALRFEDGRLLRIPSVVRWEQGDWRFVLSRRGQSGVALMDSLDGFIPWRGA